MDYGFLMLSRKFFMNTYWKQKRTFSPAEAWLDLIAMARFEKSPEVKLLENGREITVNRGEIHASIRYLSERWGWSTDRTRKFLVSCIAKNEISRTYVQGETVLKLCRYDFYNPTVNSDKDSSKNSGKDSNQTAARANSNKDKKEEELKEREKLADSPTPQGDLAVLVEQFNEFRAAYRGTKRGLETELADFKSRHKDWKEAIPLLMPALDREVAYRNQLVSSERFEPSWKNLKTWLNQRCWEQEFSLTEAKISVSPQIKIAI
jgi:hypothetical protein